MSQGSTVSVESGSAPDIQDLLRKFTNFSPDPCGPPYGEYRDSTAIESRLFRWVSDNVTQALNDAHSDSAPARARAIAVLKKLQTASAEINASWPEENHFQFQLLDLSPAFVVKTSIRTHGRYFVFAVPEEYDGKPNRLWQMVGSSEDTSEEAVPELYLELYPLHRGPSGNARFLAKFVHSGCAGSVGVSYDARQWDPKSLGSLEQIIKQAGAVGLDSEVKGFEPIGKLSTDRSLITIPYCWFSAIDTWDNPSLCAVDTYDVSGDDVKFRNRTYNRPDLLPVARVIEFAEQRDYPAVLGYCATSRVAHELVRDVPPSLISAEELIVTRTRDGKEHVAFSTYHPSYQFDVEKRAGRWLVVGFSSK
jgi:hypothetical protein